MTRDEAAAVESLSMDGASGVAGLGIFSNLKNLTLSGEALRSVDVADCTALESLSADGCTQLAEVLLGDKPVLSAVSAPGAAIAAIDFSQAPALETLDLEGSPLPELALDACPNLAALNVRGTALTALDLSGNGALTELLVDDAVRLDNLDATPLHEHWAVSSFTRAVPDLGDIEGYEVRAEGEFDDAGRLVALSTYQYDQEERYEYSYDEAGRLVAMDDSGTNGSPAVHWDVSYDEAGRLSQASSDLGGSYTVGYGANGLPETCRAAEGQGGASTLAFSYNDAGRLASWSHRYEGVDEKNADRMQAMDLLLLTQGWRRYVWELNGTVRHGEMFLRDDVTGIQTLGSKKKSKGTGGAKQLIQVSGAEGNSTYLMTDSLGRFTVDTDLMKTLRGGYVYLKPMLSKEFKPELEIQDYFPAIDSIRRKKSFDCSLINCTQRPKEEIYDAPVVSGDSTILLDEVVIARKARKPFRDKLMGRLDSLAQMNLNSVYVCTSCGLLLNYNPDYQGHHALVGEGGCPAKGRKQPVDGETYRIAKYKYYGDAKGGGVYFSVVDAHSVVYHAAEFTEEELLRMNNMWRVKGYYGKREFYQPDEIDMQLPVPDARNTLLWAPSVVTDEKGEATVSFYCSDINTGFIGVAEGVDGTGLLETDQCEFRVIRRAD